MSSNEAAIMRAVGITKAYGGTHALRGVDFEIRRGAVTVLLGENGAGKSTLMKIMSGVEQPTSGHVELDGRRVEFGSPSDAVDHGVAIIHQELNLCPNLSVSDNLFLGRERTRRGVVDQSVQRLQAKEVLARMEEPISARTPVGDLRLGQQQVVEIARALAQNAQVLIMDEPTSALSTTEVRVLFRVIRELTASGVAIVYISHHLDECLEIGDYAVVLRDGALVAKAPVSEIDLRWIVSKMVGRDQDELYTPIDSQPGETILEVEDLIVTDPASPGRMAVRDLSLSVRAGEVVGVYGLMGAGRTELLETVAGRHPAVSGRVRLHGRDITSRSIGNRIDSGVILVPEDRQRDGLVQSMSVGQNLSLAAIGSMVKGLFVRRAREEVAVGQSVDQVRVKTSGAKAAIGSLSGGNQQKVVIGKALMTEPDLLLLDEPTRGIDVGAKADIFALMAKQAATGVAVLFATSEVSEVLNASSRIIVLARGRIAVELDPRTATREQILAASDVSDAEPTPGAPA